MFRHTLFPAIKAVQPARQYARDSERHFKLQRELSELVGNYRAVTEDLEMAKKDLEKTLVPKKLIGEARAAAEKTRDYFAHLSKCLPPSLGEDCAKLAISADRLLNKKSPSDLSMVDERKDRVKFFQEVKCSIMFDMSKKQAEIAAECAETKPQR